MKHPKVGVYSESARSKGPLSTQRNQFNGATDIKAPGYKRGNPGRNPIRKYSGDIPRRRGIVRHSPKEAM